MRATLYWWRVAAAALVWCVAAAVRGQAPVEPPTPAIVAYVHVENPAALGDAVQQMLVKAGGAGLAPDAFRVALADEIGDLNLKLLPRDAPMTIAWVQPPGENGASKRIVVMPEMHPEGNAYVADCLTRTNQTNTIRLGLSFIGPKGTTDWLDALAAPLKALHEATQSTDVSCFFRAPFLAERHDALVRALSNVSPLELASFLRATPLPTASAGSAASGLGPVAPGGAAGNQDVCRVLGALLADVESLHVAVDPSKSPIRLAVNLTAQPRTDLAKFLNRDPTAADPLVQFVPPDGYLRAALALDGKAADEFAHKVLERAFPASDPQAPRGRELANLVGMLLGFDDLSAIVVRPRKADGSSSWLFVTTPRDPADAPQELQSLGERTDLFLHGARPAAGPGGATPEGTGAGLLPVMPGASDSTLGKARRTLLVTPSAEILEKFPIGRMDDTAVASPPAAGVAPMLMFCQAGSRLVVGSERSDVLASVNRVLRLDPLWPTLLAQKTFVGGGSLYLDLRPAGEAAQAAWDKSPVVTQVTARLGGNCAQFAASIPVEMLAPAAAPIAP